MKRRLYAYQGKVPVLFLLSSPKLLIGSLVLCLMLTACGGPSIAALKAGIAGFGPLITVLVSKGKISQEKAQLYSNDANKLLDAYEVLSTSWKAATTKGAKVESIRVFVNTTAPITQDFGQVPELATALAILNTTVSIIQAFYGDAPAARPGVPATEKELADYVKKQAEKLKQAVAAR